MGSPASPVESSAPAFPCTNGGKSVHSPFPTGSERLEIKDSSPNQPQRNTEVLLSAEFMSASDETQEWSFLNGSLEEEAVHSFGTLNGRSQPQSCEEAFRGCHCGELSIQDSAFYASLSAPCQLLLSF